MWAPGSTGQLNLFIGDRAHIPMYIALSRHSCSQAQHLRSAGVSDNSTRWYKHSSTQSSSGCSVTLSPGRPNRRHPRCTVSGGVYQCYAIDGAHRALVEGNSLQHSALQPAPWWDQSVTGGTNPGPREPRCPGQPSQGPGLY